jgi:hypothetical protein
MISNLNPRWMAVILVWFAAIIASYLNFTQIHELASIREKNVRLRQEMLFQYRNAARLDQIQSVQASCYLPVASAKLGFEAIRSRLQRLAIHLGLNGVKIEGRMDQVTGSQVPLRLRMQGTFEQAGKYITALKSAPYLAMKKSRVVIACPKPDAEIELEFDFQFENDPQRESEIGPLQAAANPPEPKAVTR